MLRKKTKGVTRDTSQEKIVAIDIGLYSVKFAYFNKEFLCLDEFPLFDQPKDLRGLKEQELFNIQTSAINKALTMINPKADIVLSPQPSLQVLTRVLTRPPDSDIKGYLNKEFPFEPDQFSYDTQSIDEGGKVKRTKKADKKHAKLAVSVADLDFIQRSIGLLGKYQLQIKRFTPGPVGLMNYLLLTANADAEQSTVFIDLGALYSHLIVYKGRDQFLARTLEIGGNHFNQELVEKLNVDFETAEKIKTERKLIDDSLFDSKGASTSMPMFQAINSILFGLVDEIKNSMTFFEDYFVEDLSDAFILIAGGTSRLENLDRFLEKELELPVRRAENAIHRLTPDHPFSPQFAATVGLLADPSRPNLLNINLMNNIEGLLFKVEDGDYYLTKEGFVNKKKYKRKQKTFKPTVVGRFVPDARAPGLSPLTFIKVLPAKIKAFLRGEKIEMREMRISFSGMDLGSIKNHLKTIFILAGALFLVAYGVNQFFWAPKRKALDRSISRYVAKTAEVNQVRTSLMSGTGDADEMPVHLKAEVSRIDKIVWANKLRAIADAVPERVWISALVIQGTPPAMVLSCHVYSYGEAHLKDIALFIENLKARKTFMDDFTEVKFHAAQRNPKDKDVYDFTFTLPLKRDTIREIKETIEKEKV
jgi:hypothetical protein